MRHYNRSESQSEWFQEKQHPTDNDQNTDFEIFAVVRSMWMWETKIKVDVIELHQRLENLNKFSTHLSDDSLTSDINRKKISFTKEKIKFRI